MAALDGLGVALASKPLVATALAQGRLVAPFPDWVVDYVIVHELAHLRVGGHGDEFWQLVGRYPKAERAIGYLLAKAGDEDEPTPEHDTDRAATNSDEHVDDAAGNAGTEHG